MNASWALMLLAAAGAAAEPRPAQGGGSLDRVLAAYVRDGRVDYAALKREPAGLDAWLAAAAGLDESRFRARPRDAQLAFLINLYNAATLRLILDHYPISSIRGIGPVWDPNRAWKLPVVKVFGRAVTLNQLEHEMIRPVYKEPRVHFALVCAAKGCPPLRSEAYDGVRLDAQLEDQARVFLSESSKNRADASTRTAHLSPIFKWYAEDFGGSHASALEFVRKWLPVEPGWTVRWTEYDWSLNEGGR